MKLLVLGSMTDPHVAAVTKVLRSRGATIAVYDETAPPGTDLALNENGGFALRCERLPLTGLDAVDLIWLRLKAVQRRKWLENHETLQSERAKVVAHRQWGLFYDNLLTLFGGPVVDDPGARQAQANKLWQQRLAGKLGLHTPPTLVTTRKSSALAFYDEHGAIIVKPLGAPNIPRLDDPTQRQGLTTAPVARTDIEQADDQDFVICPSYFQKYIAKKFELRVVIVGKKHFSFRIDSQDCEISKIDWRFGIGELNFEISTIKADILKMLYKYLDISGLTTASFDLIIDPDDRPWFLECNPDGQWFWLDQLAEGAISRAFADHLISSVGHCIGEFDRI